jgi:class 3 adenylate cyclase/pimeloyl-ACP methyl ester carboxylesterase
MAPRDTRYARTPDETYIAYQTNGEGPIDLVYQFDWFGNVDAIWEDPDLANIFAGLASFSRLILHDRRGTGLSSRNVPVPNLETRIEDLCVVLDKIGAERPVLGGEREGGAPNLLLAATDPQRVRSLFWYSPSARSTRAPDYPWGAPPEYVELDQRALEQWGTEAYGRAFIDTEGAFGHEIRDDEAQTFAKLSRATATPDVARELARVWYETDVRDVLGSVRVPTLLLAYEGNEIEVAEAMYVASLMPDAELVIRPGTRDADLEGFCNAVRDFLGVDRAPDIDSILSTVLFTDIVDSTAKQAQLGDHRWKALVERHHAVVREVLGRWRGAENDTSGDGFYATFDGPARAIRCAQEIIDRVHDLGIAIRAGIHTGECELINDKVGGITVTIGARVSALAGPSEVLISQTVKDLVAGSGLTFEDAGEHELKGVPDRWRLYRVVG